MPHSARATKKRGEKNSSSFIPKAPQIHQHNQRALSRDAHAAILHLQRTVGNRAVERMWNSGALQAKLNIGPANDKYEQEADRIAEQVVSMSEPGPPPSSLGENPMWNSTPLQRKNPAVFAGRPPQVSRAPLADTITPLRRSVKSQEEEAQGAAINMWGEAEAPLGAEAGGETSPRLPEEEEKAQGKFLQKKCASCEQEEAQAKTILSRKTGWGIPHQDNAAPANVESAIQSARSGGRPLSPVERSYYEPRFGADFAGVKIHTDSNAAQLSRSVNARAFTVRPRHLLWQRRVQLPYKRGATPHGT